MSLSTIINYDTPGNFTFVLGETEVRRKTIPAQTTSKLSDL